VLKDYIKKLSKLALRPSFAATNGVAGAALAGAMMIWRGVLPIMAAADAWAPVVNWTATFILYAAISWIILFILEMIFISPFRLWVESSRGARQADPNEEKQKLITQARDFIATTIREDPGYEHFQHTLESSEVYLKLRPYLKEDFHRALTSGRVLIVTPRASNMPGIAWSFIAEIDRLEKEWNLTL
jgi:hypothetical protein